MMFGSLLVLKQVALSLRGAIADAFGENALGRSRLEITISATTTTTAVQNGSIRLVYHRDAESFIFDAASENFITAGDVPLQLFALAASEVPALFQQLAPGDDGIQRATAKWFITLPQRTLAHLLGAASVKDATTILNDRAIPI